MLHRLLLTFGVADGKSAVAAPLLGVRGLSSSTIDSHDGRWTIDSFLEDTLVTRVVPPFAD